MDTSTVLAFTKTAALRSKCSAMETCLRMMVGAGDSVQLTGPAIVILFSIAVLTFSVIHFWMTVAFSQLHMDTAPSTIQPATATHNTTLADNGR